jgi:dipeptide/tripeptide permease
MSKYTRAFWTANTAEMLERMAYYAVFIVITFYLSNTLGFSDIEAGIISGLFSGGLYLLPLFTGAFADKMGYRKSIIIAFSLLSAGYLLQGLLPVMLESLGLVQYGEKTVYTGLIESWERYLIVPVLIILMIGGAFIKSIISASVARETTSETRAKGYSIFYMMVNIGSFTGKSVIDPLRSAVGDSAYIYINFFSATLCAIAFIAVLLFYHSAHHSGEGKSIKEVVNGLTKVFSNGRLLILILIVTGFWIVQQQLYATMPKYVIRLAGETARPGWIANVNPFVVVVCVNFVTQLMAKRKALTSIIVGMFLIPLSALVMATGNLFEGEILSLHPISFMMITGIAIQALAECFISPRYLEYFSLQAPKGEEGLYLGFSHLHSFLSSILGFGLSGFLLAKYCPEPTLFESSEAWQAATVNAHYIWYWFAAIGMISAIALILYAQVNKNKAENI